MNVRVVGLTVLAMGTLVACSGSAAPTQSPQTSAVSKSSSPVANTTTPTHDQLAAWCQLSIGESKAAVVDAMGTPDGHKADAYKPQGYDAAEWDSGNTILLATFTDGKATNLQAYDEQVGPQGSTRIGCASFRH